MARMGKPTEICTFLREACHKSAVGLSANTSAASAFFTRFFLQEEYIIFPPSIDEETLKNLKKEIFPAQAGYTLLRYSSTGSANVNTLTAQAYSAFRQNIISTRHAAVSPKGPITARLRLMVWAKVPSA